MRRKHLSFFRERKKNKNSERVNKKYKKLGQTKH
jgi:hypothetical protein